MSGVFVTGTDTGVGKTFVSAALLRALRMAGVDALAMKPVASGSVETADGLRNEDALALLDAMRTPLPGGAAGEPPAYGTVNPYALRDPIAPHLAAANDGVEIDLGPIRSAWLELSARSPFVLVEGAGGWLIPLSEDRMQADLPIALGLPVLLVVGVRLGCINHALLTARAIRDDGLELVGWVANMVDPALPQADEVIDTIACHLDAPLAVMPRDPDPTAVAQLLAAAVERLCLRLRDRSLPQSAVFQDPR
jgi:dethiobiotin synthetase